VRAPDPGEWNWRLGFENAIEGYHVLGTHLASAGDLDFELRFYPV
jgi:hypothetical protein